MKVYIERISDKAGEPIAQEEVDLGGFMSVRFTHGSNIYTVDFGKGDDEGGITVSALHGIRIDPVASNTVKIKQLEW